MSEFEMMKVNEISLDEMGNIAGGRVKKPAAKAGCTLYLIKPGDTLLLLGDETRGIAIPRKGTFASLFEIAFQEQKGDAE